MTLPSIALISFVLLALQIVLIQAVSTAQGHHLAYVILSIALLGFGAGGSVLTLRSIRNRQRLRALYAPALILCAWSTAWLGLPARTLLEGLEIDLIFVHPGPWIRLIGLGIVLFIPFFSGAAALSAAFTVLPDRIGRLYSANLAGSAAGAATVLPALHWVLPEQMLPLLAGTALLAALPSRPRKGVLSITAAGILVAAFLSPDLPRSPYKAFSYALRLPGALHSGPFPHPLGRVDQVEAHALRYAPDLSLRYTGPVPSPPHLYIDGEPAGVLLDQSDPAALILQHTPRALPFHAGIIGTALLLNPDGTPPALSAAAKGFDITLVEPHSHIADRIIPHLPPEVTHVERCQPRRVLSQLKPETIDLVIFPVRGVFGGPGGLQTLGEDPLFTVEAVRKALRSLTPTGALSFNVWLDEPLRHALRIVDLAAVALREEGVASPQDHLVLIRGWGSASLLVTRNPLDTYAARSIAAFTETEGFDQIWPSADRPRNHGETGDQLDQMTAALLGPDPDSFREAYPFDIRAPTDDRPFFNQFLRMGTQSPDATSLSAGERGLHLLLHALLLLATAGVVLILGPLLALGRAPWRTPFTLLCYTGLGAGFMLFEIALIQRLMPLWGHAATSTALVITALLAGMGAGSLISHQLPARRGVLVAACLIAVFLTTTVLGLLEAWIAHLFEWSAFQQTLCVMLILPLAAVPLGIPFPLGIRVLATHDERQIPWACGIDGAVAVITAPSAALLAFALGYSSLSVAVAAAYLLAALGTLCSAKSRV